jgi:lysophospholipase L1-like esterase
MIFAFGLAEIGFRLYYLYLFKKNTVVVEEHGALEVFSQEITVAFVGSDGIEHRSRDHAVIKALLKNNRETVFRIIGMGDSITYGYGCKEPQKNLYLYKLRQEILQQKKVPCEIINGAVGGYGTWQELKILEDILSSFNGDLIIAQICMNDFYDQVLTAREIQGKALSNIRDASKARHFNFLYQHSDFFKYLYDILSHNRQLALTQKGFEEYLLKLRYELTAEELTRWEEGLNRMRAVAEAKRIPILFVIVPLHSQLLQGNAESYAPLSDYFRKTGAHYIDLMARFREEHTDFNRLYDTKDNIHPTAAGHAIMADEIMRYLRSK